MIPAELLKRIASLIKDVPMSSAVDVAEAIGMNLLFKRESFSENYEWYSYTWPSTLETVNMLQEPNGLKRIEFIIASSNELQQTLLDEWKNAAESVFGIPLFQGTFRQQGFPQDEDGLDVLLWNIGRIEILLLNRKEDAETPQELVLVIKQ